MNGEKSYYLGSFDGNEGMKWSAIWRPDYVVQLVVSPGEEQQPLVLADVGRTAPAWIPSEDLHVPSSGPGILDLGGDELGIAHEVLRVDAAALLHQLERKGLLGVSDAGTLLLQDHFNRSPEDVGLDCSLLPWNEVGEAKLPLHFEGEHAHDEQEE